MVRKDCRTCKYHNYSPVGIFPLETCSIHIHYNMDKICDDYTTSKWIQVKEKLKGILK